MALRTRAFTIIELLVVIVVISILAMITAALYTNAQVQTRDAQIKDAAVKYASAIQLASASNKGIIPKGGWGSTSAATSSGCADGAGGWQGRDLAGSDSNYKCTIADALVAMQYLKADFFDSLPNSVQSSNKLIFNTQTCYPSGKPAEVYLLYSQEDPDQNDTNALAALASSCPNIQNNAAPYGLKAFIKLDVAAY